MEAKKHRRNQRKHSQVRPKATTSAILGNAKAQVPIDPKWREQYQSLLDMRDQLRQQKGRLVQAATEAYTGPRRDPADVGTNLYDCDWALSMASSDQSALYEIDEALNRIHSGTYGICQLTGKPIAADRLAAIPWTRFSTEAEHQLEVTGQLGRARLGTRESLTVENQGDDDGIGDDGEESEAPRKSGAET